MIAGLLRLSRSLRSAVTRVRDHDWLKNKLDLLLKKYFSDIKITNPVEIRFGREAKFRFGSIKLLKPRGLKGVTANKPSLTGKKTKGASHQRVPVNTLYM
mgnify:CR=1 FL=1